MDFDRRAEDKTTSNILILGNSGQGKSYLLKLLLANLRESGKSVIVLDVEAEYQERDYIPNPGDIILFCWADCQAGDADHVRIVERVEGNTIYTIEGNSGDSVRQNSYPVGYYEIRGYGVPLLQTAGKEG